MRLFPEAPTRTETQLHPGYDGGASFEMFQSALSILQKPQYPLNTAEGPSQEAREFVGPLVPIWS
jgi:hypothetical protein